MRRKLGLFCLIGMMSVGGMAISQTVHRTVHRPTVMYSPSPFSGTLAPHYMGNDLRQIYDIVASRFGKGELGIGSPGEFETTVDYHARLRRALDTPIANGITAGSDIAFVIPSSLHNHIDEIDEGSLITNYDADHSEMSVWIQPSMTYQIGEPGDVTSLMHCPLELHSVAIVWGANEIAYSAWRGSNAFGASVKVMDKQYDAYGLAFDVGQPWGASGLTDLLIETGLKFTFPVSVDEAKTVKNRLRVLIVCRMEDNPLMQGTDYHKATITSPYETTARYRYLHVTPTALWIFDDETGKVYLKEQGDFFEDARLKKE